MTNTEILSLPFETFKSETEAFEVYPDLERSLLYGPSTPFSDSILFDYVQKIVDNLQTDDKRRGAHVSMIRFGKSGDKSTIEAVLTRD